MKHPHIYHGFLHDAHFCNKVLLRVISMPRVIHARFRKTDSTVIKIHTGKENFKIIKNFLPEKLVLFT